MNQIELIENLVTLCMQRCSDILCIRMNLPTFESELLTPMQMDAITYSNWW